MTKTVTMAHSRKEIETDPTCKRFADLMGWRAVRGIIGAMERGDDVAAVDITTRALASKRGNRLTEIDGDGEEAEGQGQEGRSCGAA